MILASAPPISPSRRQIWAAPEFAIDCSPPFRRDPVFCDSGGEQAAHFHWVLTDPKLLFERAQRHYSDGRAARAYKILQHLLSQFGEQADLLHLLGLVEAARGRISKADRAFARATQFAPNQRAIFQHWADIHRRRGHFARSEAVLRAAIARNPHDQELLVSLAELKRDVDERDDAALVYDHLLQKWPADPQLLSARAHVELERGRDACGAFERALQAAPHDRGLLPAFASALRDSGRAEEAVALLRQSVNIDPGWIEGLRALARLRADRGDGETFADDHLEALRKRPRDIRLWASFLGLLASALSFGRVLDQLPQARKNAGPALLFDLLEAQALSETGRIIEAEQLFAKLDKVNDPNFIVARMRFLLRSGHVERAARLGEAVVEGEAVDHIWPLLGLAWRKIDDDRWRWLEPYGDTVQTFDLPLDGTDLTDLAGLLRTLHRNAAPPYDQSARGGTQTIGNLLQRTDGPITRLRKNLRDALSQYVAALPRIDPKHPFLGRPRNRFRFAGSWSILLKGGGFHVNHTHPAGWVSSAFYVALPPPSETNPQDGWLKFGGSPPELGLDLSPVRIVEPRPGRLVLFPSITWHGTMPFKSGERLTVAFDVVPGGG